MNKSNKSKCLKCGYAWETKSDHVYVTCPSCLGKVKIKDEGENDDDD